MRRDKSGEILDISSVLSYLQFSNRHASHQSSAYYESRHLKKDASNPNIKIGDKVFIKSERTKNKARDIHIVGLLGLLCRGCNS